MNKRERFLKGNAKAKKAFRKWHGVSVDAPERNPWSYHSAEYCREHPDWVKSTFGAYRKTRVFCSRPCCGNPRKWYNKVTMQERRQDDRDKISFQN